MANINIKNTLGTINFTDFVHVIAAKVSNPTAVVYETWIDVPVTNFSFVIPNLEPENYYISFYDAPTNSSLGTLVLQIIVNGLTGEFIFERRFYTVDGPNAYDPADGALSIDDPYLIGKTVTGFFKEGFRYYEPGTEYEFDTETGILAILTGIALNAFEKVSVEIKYTAGTVAPGGGGGGLYDGTVTITATEHTLTTDDINKRVRCDGSASTQKVLLPSLASITVDAGYYFDNSVKGTAVQVKLLVNGLDRIRFNGFMLPSDLLEEFWVSKGEHVLLRKADDACWEVITDYKGTNVGEMVVAGFKGHPGIITENGQLIDGDEYPRLWWWIDNVLPATHKYTTDAVTDPIWVPETARLGQFAVHSTLKKFRMPSTFSMAIKGLGDFETYGADTTNRPVDYPGGLQVGQVGEFTESSRFKNGKSDQTESGTQDQFLRNPLAGGDNYGFIDIVSERNQGKENRVPNIGVIYGRRI